MQNTRLCLLVLKCITGDLLAGLGRFKTLKSVLVILASHLSFIFISVFEWEDKVSAAADAGGRSQSL